MNEKIESILKKAVGELQKKYGKESVNYLGNTSVEPIPRIGSQCIAIDEVTGGGYPIGRIIEIFGGESSGKTTSCYHAIAEAQQKYPDKFCALVDSEFSFDPIYASQCGVKVDELVVAQPDSGTDGFAILQGLIETGSCSLIVVDSVAAMVPREEVEEEDFGKSTIGLQARMMSKALRKLTSVIGRYKVIVIFTNQTREKVGVMYGSPECVTPETIVKTEGRTPYRMEDLFSQCGLRYETLEKNTPYDVSDFNIKIKSYNHRNNETEYKRVLSLVRKDDSFVYELVSDEGEILLRSSGNHRIWDNEEQDYFHVHEIEYGAALNESGEEIYFTVRKTEELSPIVDLEVEDNSNYFTNGILSHNTTAGGNALKFYASIRLKFSKIGTIETGSGDNKEKTSVRTRVEAVKNKTAAPFKKAEFIISFGKGIDNEAAYFDAIIERGLVQVKGAGWYSIDGKNVAQGTTKLKAYFEENPEIYERLKSAVMNNTTAAPAKEEPVEANNMTDDEIAESVEEEVGEFPAKG